MKKKTIKPINNTDKPLTKPQIAFMLDVMDQCGNDKAAVMDALQFLVNVGDEIDLRHGEAMMFIIRKRGWRAVLTEINSRS